MRRPTFSVYIATSLDGFIARPDGTLDWLSIVERAGEDYGYKRFFDSVDTLVMGRKTYKTALAFDTWPYEGKRCIVLSRTPPPSRHGEEFYSGEVGGLVERLLASRSKRVYVDGGSIVSQFVRLGLVDDVTVSIVPVLLGDGVRLTQSLGRDVRLELTASRAYESGLVQLQYRYAP